MNKLKVTLGSTVTNKPYTSNRYDLELELETQGDPLDEANKLFDQARSLIKKQMEIDANGHANSTDKSSSK